MKAARFFVNWLSRWKSVFVLSMMPVTVLGLAVMESHAVEAEAAYSAEKGSSINVQSADRSSSGCTSTLVSTLSEALAKGRTEQARIAIADLMRCRSVSSDLLFEAGSGLIDKDLYPEAAEVFSRCIEDYPHIFECHYNLALVQFALERPSNALATLQKAPRASGEQTFAIYNLLGKTYEALGQTDRAEQELSAAYSGAPQEENYALDLGLFYLRQRAYEKAGMVFDHGTEHHPRSPYLMLGISLAQFMGGHEAESVETCRRLLELQPDFSSARLLMAFALYIGGRYAEAEKIAADGLQTEHPHPYLYYLHAAVLLKLQSREYDRMLRELGLASSGIPGCSLCYFTESKIYQAMDKTQAAIAELEKAVAADPGYSEAWYRLAALYERVGRHEDSTRSYARFRESKDQASTRETDLIRDLLVPKVVTTEKRPAHQ